MEGDLIFLIIFISIILFSYIANIQGIFGQERGMVPCRADTISPSCPSEQTETQGSSSDPKTIHSFS